MEPYTADYPLEQLACAIPVSCSSGIWAGKFGATLRWQLSKQVDKHARYRIRCAVSIEAAAKCGVRRERSMDSSVRLVGVSSDRQQIVETNSRVYHRYAKRLSERGILWRLEREISKGLAS